MVTPSKFKERYLNLPVKRKNGTVQTVRVGKYRLNGSNVDAALLKAFRDNVGRGADDITIFTETGEVKISGDLRKQELRLQKKTHIKDIHLSMERNGHLVAASSTAVDLGGSYALLGKGSPEHCQVVLQLAERWGLAKHGLQDYADKALGLDCNGFVGNYIHYGRKGVPWSESTFHAPMGADIDIDKFFRNLTFINRWEDLNPANTYIFGLVGPNNKIIPGGSSHPGHIMITEAGKRTPGLWDTLSPRVWVVESTAGALEPGLTEGWYSCLEYDEKTGVFTMDRGVQIKEKKREIKVKIAQVT